MGVLGYSEFFNFNYSLVYNYNVDFCVKCLFHGMDYIYSYFNFMNFFNMKLIFMNFFNNFYFFNFNNGLFLYWLLSLFSSSYSFIFSYIIDYFFFFNSFKLFFLDGWYNNFLNIENNSYMYMLAPEIFFLKSQIFYYLFMNFYTSFFFSLFNIFNTQMNLFSMMMYIQLIIMIFFLMLMISIYFSNVLSFSKEENYIDIDYYFNFLVMESEKEITCFDDMILTLMFILFIFGWYFYMNCWLILTNIPELTFIFILFPLFYLVIIGIPSFLMYDFGIYYLIYLKGVASSSVIFFELLFDYIAVMMFYTSILVQGVRLVLMTFMYFSMHELVMEFSFKTNLFCNIDMKNEMFQNFYNNNNFFSYYFLFMIPAKFLNWMYEVFHMFFVITVQFIAFFAIVFWLFLFLYTFFVLEKQENFFFEKSNFSKNYFLKTNA